MGNYKYTNEGDGQADFFEEFGIDPERALILNTDGVWNGNLLEFKVSISDVNAVLFQAVKYLSKLRINGRPVPANMLLVDLNAERVYVYKSEDYFEDLHQVFLTSASREVGGFRAKSSPEVIDDYFGAGAQRVVDLLKQTDVVPVRIDHNCVVAWAERFYREVRGSTKADFLRAEIKKGPLGELKDPRHFRGEILPYEGDTYEEFSHILDRLNDKLKKIELGAFYTPEPYVKKSYELLREAIDRVPAGNDYVIIDRCAGTGNLQRFLTEEELSHCIVNTYEEFEYLELAREFNQRVRAVIPPTYKAGDPKMGLMLNGDALSDRFVLGALNADGTRTPNVIQQYLDDPKCTIILFENPPYSDVAGVESNKEDVRGTFIWKNSWVKKQMQLAMSYRGTSGKALRDLSSLFIWSAFEYYLRQPTDSYVVFSPPKYFKFHNLVNKKYLRGFLFNRKHFHASTPAGVACILWSQEDEPNRTSFEMEMWDIDTKTNELVSGAKHKDWTGGATITVKKASRALSDLYDQREPTGPGVAVELNGNETTRELLGVPKYDDQTVGYLVTKGLGFENADLNSSLNTAPRYDFMGAYLFRDAYLKQLPLFAACRLASVGRYWIRGVLSRNADSGDNFSHDQEFLKACLIFTALAYHNKCRSFTGSDGRGYRNELCLDEGTVASEDLKTFTLDQRDKDLLEQWDKVLQIAKTTRNYNPAITYGTYQIAQDLNTSKKVKVGRDMKTVYDYPVLNGELNTLKKMTMQYHAEAVTPKLWEYGLVK
ncbi:hypothetical protein ACUJ8O_11365 [Micrococcus sp. EWR3.9.1]|uniref:hypothetical protein n=1 Tax=Micrococcus sp. EWR3.9.1 TaxID=3461010 RepID=UPI0040438AD3